MRKLSAIMFTDIVGYTAIMGKDERLAIQTVTDHESTLKEGVPKYKGEIINFFGDGCLSIFPSATLALECALDMQKKFKNLLNVPLRIGIHIGEVLLQDGNIYGNGVNVASRIESLGQAGTVFFSADVFDKIKNNSLFKVTRMGSYEFKNVEGAMDIFALANEGLFIPEKESLSGKLKVDTTIVDEAIKSIAVLPFETNNQDEAKAFIIDGITDEIRSQLTTIQKLKVISRSSCMHFKGKSNAVQDIAEQLNVAYVLEGRIYLIGDQVKVSTDLINIKLNKQIWSLNPIVQRLEDIFQFQNDTALRVVKELQIALSTNEEEHLTAISTQNSNAQTQFQKAYALLHKSVGNEKNLEDALALLNEAVKIDPDFSRAHTGIADSYLEYIFWGRKPSKKVLDKALHAAQTALALDPNSGEAYGALGSINFFKFNKLAASRFLEKAIHLSPNYTEPYEKLAWISTYDGDAAEALDYLSIAQALDPLSARYFGDTGHVYFYSGKFEEGIASIDHYLNKFPDDKWLLWIKAYLYSGKKDYESAIKMHQQRSPLESNTNWMLAHDLGKIGEHQLAQAILDQHLLNRPTKHIPAFMVASIYMGMDHHDQALAWLERDYQEGGQGIFFWGLKSDPKFSDLHQYPRFQALLKLIN